MLTLVFVILMFVVFGKLIGLAIRATWGITKVLFTIVFLPVILICMVVGGLISVALPVLAVIGVVALIGSKA
ncbi:MAG: hypothetical protein PHQ72_06140 [Hespellia sp.]|nr:hypothetical protein [Hespellia sp.]